MTYFRTKPQTPTKNSEVYPPPRSVWQNFWLWHTIYGNSSWVAVNHLLHCSDLAHTLRPSFGMDTSRALFIAAVFLAIGKSKELPLHIRKHTSFKLSLVGILAQFIACIFCSLIVCRRNHSWHQQFYDSASSFVCISCDVIQIQIGYIFTVYH